MKAEIIPFSQQTAFITFDLPCLHFQLKVVQLLAPIEEMQTTGGSIHEMLYEFTYSMWIAFSHCSFKIDIHIL